LGIGFVSKISSFLWYNAETIVVVVKKIEEIEIANKFREIYKECTLKYNWNPD
jgi:hypothetical protein